MARRSKEGFLDSNGGGTTMYQVVTNINEPLPIYLRKQNCEASPFRISRHCILHIDISCSNKQFDYGESVIWPFERINAIDELVWSLAGSLQLPKDASVILIKELKEQCLHATLIESHITDLAIYFSRYEKLPRQSNAFFIVELNVDNITLENEVMSEKVKWNLTHSFSELWQFVHDMVDDLNLSDTPLAKQVFFRLWDQVQQYKQQLINTMTDAIRFIQLERSIYKAKGLEFEECAESLEFPLEDDALTPLSDKGKELTVLKNSVDENKNEDSRLWHDASIDSGDEQLHDLLFNESHASSDPPLAIFPHDLILKRVKKLKSGISLAVFRSLRLACRADTQNNFTFQRERWISHLIKRNSFNASQQSRRRRPRMMSEFENIDWLNIRNELHPQELEIDANAAVTTDTTELVNNKNKNGESPDSCSLSVDRDSSPPSSNPKAKSNPQSLDFKMYKLTPSRMPKPAFGSIAQQRLKRRKPRRVHFLKNGSDDCQTAEIKDESSSESTGQQKTISGNGDKYVAENYILPKIKSISSHACLGPIYSGILEVKEQSGCVADIGVKLSEIRNLTIQNSTSYRKKCISWCEIGKLSDNMYRTRSQPGEKGIVTLRLKDRFEKLYLLCFGTEN